MLVDIFYKNDIFFNVPDIASEVSLDRIENKNSQTSLNSSIWFWQIGKCTLVSLNNTLQIDYIYKQYYQNPRTINKTKISTFKCSKVFLSNLVSHNPKQILTSLSAKWSVSAINYLLNIDASIPLQAYTLTTQNCIKLSSNKPLVKIRLVMKMNKLKGKWLCTSIYDETSTHASYMWKGILYQECVNYFSSFWCNFNCIDEIICNTVVHISYLLSEVRNKWEMSKIYWKFILGYTCDWDV